MLVSYVRDKNRNRIGVVVAIDRDKIGWSLCHIGLDRFNKDFGLKIATGRARRGKMVNIPQTVKSTFDKMENRARAYYKTPPTKLQG